MEQELINKIFQLIILILLTVLCRYIVPVIKAYVSEEKFMLIKNWTMAFVEAAEMLFTGKKLGDAKLEYVTNLVVQKADEIGIQLSTEDTRSLIEQAVKIMNENTKE